MNKYYLQFTLTNGDRIFRRRGLDTWLTIRDRSLMLESPNGIYFRKRKINLVD